MTQGARLGLCALILVGLPVGSVHLLSGQANSPPGTSGVALAAVAPDLSPLRLAAQASPGSAWPAALRELERGRLGLAWGYRNAAAQYRKLLHDNPRLPVAWYGLALAKLGESAEMRASDLELGLRDGRGQRQAAIEALQESLRLTPDFPAGAAVLGWAAEESRDSVTMESALTALRRSDSATGGGRLTIGLWRGRLEREVGDRDSAAAAFERIRRPGVAGVADLEYVRTRLSAGDSSAVAWYYQLAASPDSAVVSGLGDDLALIAADSVLARFAGSSPGERGELLRRFWTGRAYAELRQPGERLMEHYRRLYYARRHYRLQVTERAYGPADAYRGRDIGLDDRGVIYLRQGEPDLRVTPNIIFALPNETWVYRRPQGDLVFHFSAGGETARPSREDKFHYGGDITDYHLVRSVLDLHGAEQAPMDLLLLSRDSVSPIYGHMLNWGRHGRARAAREEARIGARSIVVGTTTDSYALRFGASLPAVANAVAFGAEPGGAQVHLALAVAGDSLVGRAPDLRVRFTLTGADGGLGARVDTTLTLSQPPQAGTWLLLHFAVPAPTGSWTYHLAVSQGASLGTVLRDRLVEVPATDGSRLALSGIVLGDPAFAVTWHPAPDEAVALSPSDAFSRAGSLQLAYELYGTAPGQRYRTRIRLTPVAADGSLKPREALTLDFAEVAQGSTLRAVRSLEPTRRRPGPYRLDVEVTDAAGRRATRSRILTLE